MSCKRCQEANRTLKRALEDEEWARVHPETVKSAKKHLATCRAVKKKRENKEEKERKEREKAAKMKELERQTGWRSLW